MKGGWKCASNMRGVRAGDCECVRAIASAAIQWLVARNLGCAAGCESSSERSSAHDD